MSTEDELVREASHEMENPRCGYQNCQDVAVNKCYECRRPICMRHTTRPGSWGAVIKCPDCAYNKPKKTGCFIATAAYGTPFAQEIDVLRRWRDISLLTNKPGRIFVRFYYAISPPIAAVVAKSEFLRLAVRESLAPMIRRLKRNSKYRRV